MQSHALAFGYGIWVRNHVGFLICAAGLAVMALFYPFLFAYSRSPTVLLASTIPLIGIFSYVLNATIFAQEPGSLASSYPRHLLVMPVKSWSLVFWPMLFGSLIAVSLLFVTAKIVYRASGLEIPLGMPALGLVVIVSWFQAIAWFPLNVRWIRALIATFAAVALGSLPTWIFLRVGQEAQLLIAAVLLTYLAAAYPLAFAALRAQRRGDSWQLWYSSEASRTWPRLRGPCGHAAPTAPSSSAGVALKFWYQMELSWSEVCSHVPGLRDVHDLGHCLAPAARPIDSASLLPSVVIGFTAFRARLPVIGRLCRVR